MSEIPTNDLIQIKLDLKKVLSNNSNSLEELANTIAGFIAEVTDAHKVILITRELKTSNYSLSGLFPSGETKPTDQNLIEEIVSLSKNLDSSTIFENVSSKSEIGLLLKKAGYQTSIFTPLQIGKEQIGMLVILNPNYFSGLPNLNSILENIGNIIALEWYNQTFSRSFNWEFQRQNQNPEEGITFNRLLFEESATGLAICSLDGAFVDVNKSFAEIMGRSTEEVKSFDYWTLVPDKYRENDKIQMDHLLKNGSYGPYEVEFVHKNQRLIPAILKGRLIEHDGRKLIWSSAENNTERKLIEKTQSFLLGYDYLNNNQNFFEILAKFLAETLEMDYICIDTLHGDLLSAQTLAIYFDGKFDENVAYTLKDTPCGDVVGNNICCFNQGVRHLFPNDNVLQDMIAESYLGTTLWGTNGKPIGLIASIGRRIISDTSTAEKILQMVGLKAASEIERMQALQELTESKNRYELAMHASSDGLYDWNLLTNEIYYSPGWKKMFGYDEHELPNDFSVWEQLVTPECQAVFRKMVNEVLNKTGEKIEIEFRMKHKDGHSVDILSRANVIFDQNGRGVRLVGTNVDISQHKATETKIKDQLKELRRWHEVTLDREERILELKVEVNQLLGNLQLPPKYGSFDLAIDKLATDNLSN